MSLLVICKTFAKLLFATGVLLGNSENSFKGECMKKLLTVVATMVLGASLAVAQASGSGSAQQQPSGSTSGQSGTAASGSTTGTDTGTAKGKKHHHKKAKKAKKGADKTAPADTTSNPK
jgi:type IV secretory pathway TrbL component